MTGVAFGALASINIVGVLQARRPHDWSATCTAFYSYDSLHAMSIQHSIGFDIQPGVPGLAHGSLSFLLHEYPPDSAPSEIYLKTEAGWPVRWCRIEQASTMKLSQISRDPAGYPVEPLRQMEALDMDRRTVLDWTSLTWCGLSAIFLSVIVGANAPATRIERTIP